MTILDIFVDLDSLDTNTLKSLQRIDEHESNEDRNISAKALDSNIIDDLKEIIDSVSSNLSLNKANSSENISEGDDDTSDDDDDDDVVTKNRKSKAKRRTKNINTNKNNLNNLKICIDDIEELIDKNNKNWFVFVIHVWNIRVPQEFNDDGESCTSWSVKR